MNKIKLITSAENNIQEKKYLKNLNFRRNTIYFSHLAH